MSANFANTSTVDKIACGSGAALDDWSSLSFIVWVYPTTALGTDEIRRIGVKFPKEFDYSTHSALSTTAAIRLRVGMSSSAAQSVSNDNQLTLNAWNFVAGTWSSGSNPQIYWGDLSTIVTEVGYRSQTAGSGSPTADASNNLVWGNREHGVPTAGDGFQGYISRGMYIERVLTLAELTLLQYNSLWAWNGFTEENALYEFGLNGTGTQEDMSGSGHSGTISNDVTLASHCPGVNPFAAGPKIWTPVSQVGGPLIGGDLIGGDLINSRRLVA